MNNAPGNATGWHREGGEPTDLQRRLLVISTAMMATMSFFWGGVYFIFDEPLAAVIPWTYMAISYLSLAAMRAPRHYGVLRATQLLFSLFLPFFLQAALGGFVNSSAVVLWSFTCPMGALVFAGHRQALYWFLAFITLVALSMGIDYPAVRVTNNLPVPMIVVFFALNIAGVTIVAFVLMRYFVDQAAAAYGMLAGEQERSERLVRNMLPAAIADRLKREPGPIADRLEGVTIAFADIVGFTPYAMERPPEEVVSLLNKTFSEFDRLCAKHGLEKIKTIGDAYMACGGLSGGPAEGAASTAAFALDAAKALEAVGGESGSKFELRIGIHTGEVVAGVIGETKYAYDVWGDAVNVAARLQQKAEPGEIVLSRETAKLIGSDFDLTDAGSAELKGHTPIEICVLSGRK